MGDRVGVIAGSGQLPVYIAQYLADAGRDVYVAGLEGAAERYIDKPDWETGWYTPYALEGLIGGLKRAGVEKVVLAGRVGHEEIFKKGEFDESLSAFMADLEDHRPATILGGLVKYLAGSGFSVLPITEVAPELLPSAGWIAGPRLYLEQLPDLDLGWRIARVIADQDIGQTAIVKSGAVVAVEAMEGTDRAIDRAGALSGGGLTVVKLAASDHDFRYDIPTIGPVTVTRLSDAGGGVIAVEAGRCLMIDFDRVAALCREKGITLISGTENEDGGVHWPEE